MNYYLDVPIEGHQPVRVEVDAPDLGMVPAGGESEPGVHRFRETLNQAMDRIHPVAEVIADKVQNLTNRPDTVQAEFGMKFSADLGVVIARTKAESHIKITLTWGGCGAEDANGDDSSDEG